MHIGQAIAINCMFLRPILKMQLTQLTQLTLDFLSSAQSCEGKFTSRHAQDMQQNNTAVEVKCCASRMTDWQGGRRGCRRGSSGGVGMNFLTVESINHQPGSTSHQKNVSTLMCIVPACPTRLGDEAIYTPWGICSIYFGTTGVKKKSLGSIWFSLCRSVPTVGSI